MEIRNIPLDLVELRAEVEDAKPTRASGYAAVFNSDSHDLGGFIERIAPGAFERTLEDAQRQTINIHALWAHDSSQPLGSTRGGKLILSEDARGLTFTLDTKRMNPAQLGALEDQDLQMSFGFRVREQLWEDRNDGTILRTLTDVDLSEVSFVINPAYPATDAAMRSLDHWKAEQRQADKIDTTEQLKRILLVRSKLHWK
jgi:HK97 family phage prohead protease